MLKRYRSAAMNGVSVREITEQLLPVLRKEIMVDHGDSQDSDKDKENTNEEDNGYQEEEDMKDDQMPATNLCNQAEEVDDTPQSKLSDAESAGDSMPLVGKSDQGGSCNTTKPIGVSTLDSTLDPTAVPPQEPAKKKAKTSTTPSTQVTDLDNETSSNTTAIPKQVEVRRLMEGLPPLPPLASSAKATEPHNSDGVDKLIMASQACVEQPPPFKISDSDLFEVTIDSLIAPSASDHSSTVHDLYVPEVLSEKTTSKKRKLEAHPSLPSQFQFKRPSVQVIRERFPLMNPNNTLNGWNVFKTERSMCPGQGPVGVMNYYFDKIGCVGLQVADKAKRKKAHRRGNNRSSTASAVASEASMAPIRAMKRSVKRARYDYVRLSEAEMVLYDIIGKMVGGYVPGISDDIQIANCKTFLENAGYTVTENNAEENISAGVNVCGV